MRRRLAAFVLPVLLTGPAAVVAQPPTPVEDWRAAYEAQLRAEYGWLSVAGLTFLEPGVNTVGSLAGNDVRLPAGQAPLEAGRIVFRDGRATLHLRPGVRATVDAAEAPRVVALNPTEGQPAPRVRVGDVEFHLHRSGQRIGIRVRDPHSPLRTGFAGTRWFAPDDAYAVIGTLEPSATPRAVPVHNVLGDVETYTSPGVLAFTIAGRRVTLVPFAASRDRLWLIFRDASAGRETYGTRFLYAEPLGGGRFRVDFNRAYNPPCAYNPHTTCPTPLPENVLPVPVRAGEQLYQAAPAITARR
jgi:uncharacterized protein (DUF1684 family)